MRHIGMLSVVAMLNACASSNPAPTNAPTQTVSVIGAGGGTVRLTPSTQASVSTVPFSVEQVWRVLPAAYDSVGIAISTLDGTARVVGNAGMKIRRQLGKVPLSRYLDCGATQVGQNADSYDVHLAVTTSVNAGEAGMATIATTVDAMAKPLAFAQEYSRCSSRGTLERRISEAVQLQLQR